MAFLLSEMITLALFAPLCHLSFVLHAQLADLNRRLPAEAGMPPSKPGPLRPRETPPPPRPSPHTITLQAPAFRNLRLPKRLRVVYFLARTRLAQRIIMVSVALRIKG